MYAVNLRAAEIDGIPPIIGILLIIMHIYIYSMLDISIPSLYVEKISAGQIFHESASERQGNLKLAESLFHRQGRLGFE